MKKDDMMALIQKELEEHPQVTSIEIAKKHRIPFHIVQIFRNKIERKINFR